VDIVSAADSNKVQNGHDVIVTSSHTSQRQLHQLRTVHHHANETSKGASIEFVTYDEVSYLRYTAMQAASAVE
jgi:hypothetical protein